MKKLAVGALFALVFGLRADVTGPLYLTARSMGMGGTGIAVSDDRLALYSNPAGLNIQREKIQVSFPALAINYNPHSATLGLLTGVRLKNFADPGAIDRSFVDDLKSVEGKHIHNKVLPSVDVVFRNFGFAVYGSSGLDAVYDAGIYEPKLTYQSRTDVVGLVAMSRRIVRPLSLGLNVKYISRLEAPKTVVWGRDITKISVNELFSNPKDTLKIEKEIEQGFSSDLGLLWHAGFFRAGAVLRNAVGKIGDENIEKQFDAGCGLWVPTLMNRGLLERFLLAVDLCNLAAERSFWTKLNLGAEAQLPLGSLRAGLNQGYPSWGFDIRFFFLEFEFAGYTQELGVLPGQIPDQNYLLVFRMGF